MPNKRDEKQLQQLEVRLDLAQRRKFRRQLNNRHVRLLSLLLAFHSSINRHNFHLGYVAHLVRLRRSEAFLLHRGVRRP